MNKYNRWTVPCDLIKGNKVHYILTEIRGIIEWVKA